MDKNRLKYLKYLKDHGYEVQRSLDGGYWRLLGYTEDKFGNVRKEIILNDSANADFYDYDAALYIFYTYAKTGSPY